MTDKSKIVVVVAIHNANGRSVLETAEQELFPGDHIPIAVAMTAARAAVYSTESLQFAKDAS